MGPKDQYRSGRDPYLEWTARRYQNPQRPARDDGGMLHSPHFERNVRRASPCDAPRSAASPRPPILPVVFRDSGVHPGFAVLYIFSLQN